MTPAGSRQRWRDHIGTITLVACPTVLVIYLAVRHGLPVGTGVRAVAGLYALNLIPGYLLLRHVFRVRSGSPFQRMVASLLLGVLVVPLIWYALCWLGIGLVFFPVMYGLAVLVPVLKGWHHGPAARLKRLVTPGDAPVLWLTLMMVVLWSFQLALVRPEGEGVAILPYLDHTLHATFVAELARSVPMESVGSLGVAKKWAYHHMPDVWADMMRRACGTTPNEAYFFVALPLRYVFVSMGFYLALVRRFGRGGAMAGVIVALAVAGVPGGSMFNNALTWYLHASYPTAFGLAGVCLILWAASLARVASPRGPLLLACVVSALLLWHKANLALPVAPAVSLLCAIVLIRRRDFRWLWLCALVQVSLVIIRYADLSTADVYPRFVFNSVGYLHTWWKNMPYPPQGSGLRTMVESLPIILEWPLIYAVCVVTSFHVGLAGVVFLFVRWRADRAKGETDNGDLVTLLILMCCGVGFVFLPVMAGADYDVSAHIVFMVHALLLMLLGPLGWQMITRVMRGGRVRMACCVVGLLVAIVVNAFALGQTALARPRPTAVIDRSFFDAYVFIRDHAAEDAVVLVADYQAPSVAGVLTGRRLVLERYGNWRLYYDAASVAADVESFYQLEDVIEMRSVLDRYGVDYVVIDEVSRRAMPETIGLVEVFRAEGASVYAQSSPADGKTVAISLGGDTATAKSVAHGGAVGDRTGS